MSNESAEFCILWNGPCPYGESTGEFDDPNICTMPCFREHYKEEE